MDTATGTPSMTRSSRGRLGTPDDLESAAHVVVLALLFSLAAIAADRLGLGAWALTTGAAAAVVVTVRHLTGLHAAVAALLGWCIATGFVANQDAQLTFGAPDLWRLVILTTAALLPRVIASSDTGGAPGESGLRAHEDAYPAPGSGGSYGR